MKYGIIVVLPAVLMVAGCSNARPRPLHPITITAVPRSTVEVMEVWEEIEFVAGYRIVTDEYIIASGYGGLFGQAGLDSEFRGLDCVEVTVPTFSRVVAVAEQAKDKDPLTFYGDLAYAREGNQPYLFEGKKVILLFKATYQGQDYEINHRPEDN